MTTPSTAEGKVDLIEILESFNRKEMFFLIGHALGNPEFTLGCKFKRQLKGKLGIDIPDKNVFVATEYHLNWIHASLVLSHYSDEKTRVEILNAKGAIKSNQEDVDLLIAFSKDDLYHLILIEAKGYSAEGFNHWKAYPNQMKSKGRRLTAIFDDNGKKYTKVKPYFCFMSGTPPEKSDLEHWPK